MRHPLLDLPPLDMLRGFVAAGRRKSITLASQDLCLSQSAVSRQIQALEEYFDAPLLVRRHRAIELTPLGDRLLAIASPFLDELGDFSREMRSVDRQPSVTITASIGVMALWILPRLGSFQSAHADIDVRVAATNRLLDLRSEGIDLAIRYCRPADAPPLAVRLFGEEVVPVASPEVARRVASSNEGWLGEVLIEYDDRARPWLRWSDWLSARGLDKRQPKSSMYFNQYDQVIHAAAAGQGIALGRVALVLPLLQEGRLVALSETGPGFSDFAYWMIPASESPRPGVAEFMAWVLREAAQTAEGVSALPAPP
ncbi:LysR substrate-binding domain-containing protein [Methylibium sp.]|uniref:LysR substrate-binding domain-containing protein n=1 Tax=Methylibium sp. TaxID=2067992 RepID=UPI0017DEA367|nr:LysR substrate-binding domain-containing protein [Methylibium sp.]MBA3591194.1 LysR family transcriptional regulator [Methylibium sp.]